MYGDCQVLHHHHPGAASGVMAGGAGGSGGGDIGMGIGMGMGMGMGMNIGIPSDPMFFAGAGGTSSMAGNSGHFSDFMPPFHHSYSSIIPKEEVLMMRKDEEIESGGSGSGQLDGLSCGEENDNGEQTAQYQQPPPPPAPPQPEEEQGQAKKKRYHRHTARQIQEMEALFKECPHPDDKQRLRLSQELGLRPRQVKFWFQNRRTQMKAQQDRADNMILRAENENLHNENFRLQSAIRNLLCPNCGSTAVLGELSFDEQHIRLENSRLKEELERLTCMAARYGVGREQLLMPQPPPPPPSLDLDMGLYGRHFPDLGNVPQEIADGGDCHHHLPQEVYGAGIVMEEEKGIVAELAVAAVEQLLRMCRADAAAMWRPAAAGKAMDAMEYAKVFGGRSDPGDIRVEGTRDGGHVIMNGITLVDAFMDTWVELFPAIVSIAKTLQILSPGVGGSCNGTLQLMFAEFRVPSPLVPARESYFFRYCQQNVEEGFWTIVDFPADGFNVGLQIPAGYKRRPSGCLIQDLSNGYSMVTWVEVAEVEEKCVHQVFDEYVRSGLAFGANRWLSALQQQCDRLASLMARNMADLGGVIPNSEARKNIMRLSQRMIKTFFHNITQTSMVHPWTSLSDSPDDPVRIATRKNTELGQHNGVILATVTTTWLPFSHLEIFELLTDEKRRSQLDALSCGNPLHEIAHIANGSHQKNCISLFRISASSNSSQNVELMLQESTTHPSGGSMVVYSNMDIDAVQAAMGGEDPSYIPILPSGFSMLPATQPAADPVPTNDDAPPPAPPMGCLLTIGLQVLASAVPSAKLNLSSITAVNNHLSNTIRQITTALGGRTNPSTPEPTPASAAAPEN